MRATKSPSNRIRRVLLLVAASAAALAVGCSDDGVLHVHGRLLNQDGTPAAGRHVATYDFELDDTDNFSATTDDQGRYELSGRLPPYAQSLDHVRVDVDSVEDFTVTALSFQVARTGDDTEVPDIRLWNDRLAVTSGPDGVVHVTWDAPPDAQAPVTLYAMQATPGTRGPISWAESVGDGATDLMPAILEDRFAAIELAAGFDTSGTCKSPVCTTFYSHVVAASKQGTMTPLSRDAACEHVSFDGRSVPLFGGAGGPCPITDGVVAPYWYEPQSWTCGAAACDPPRAVTIDLGADREISQLVIRSLTVSDGSAFDIAVSNDDATFRTVLHSDANRGRDYLYSLLAQPVTARYVRVSAPASTITQLDEVSVF